MRYHEYQKLTHPLLGDTLSMTIIGEPSDDPDWKRHVYFTLDSKGLMLSSRMLPDEARSLAAHLIAAADAAESCA